MLGFRIAIWCPVLSDSILASLLSRGGHGPVSTTPKLLAHTSRATPHGISGALDLGGMPALSILQGCGCPANLRVLALLRNPAFILMPDQWAPCDIHT